MRQVLVRFAGMVAPEVRRRAQSIGRRVLAGTSKTSVFQGYIISAKGMKDRTIVNVVELPMWYAGIPNYVNRLDMGTGTPYGAPRAELMNPTPREPGSSWSGRRSKSRDVSVYYFGKSFSEPDVLTDSYVDYLAEYHAAGDVRVTPFDRTVGVAKVFSVNKEYMADFPRYDGSFNWRASTVSIVDCLGLWIDAHTNKSANLFIESGYLSLQYGSRVRMLGMPNRLREIDDYIGRCYPGTPTPEPLWMPYREGDSFYDPNPRPFTYTNESPGARPQHCHPAFERTDSRSVVAFPCVSLPEGWDVLDFEGWDIYAVDASVDWDQTRYRRGNISASSLAFGHSGSQGGTTDNPYPGLGGVSWDAIGYGSPLLCVLGIQHRQPLTAAEVDAWEPLGYPAQSVIENRSLSAYLPAGQYRQGSRYVEPKVGGKVDADAIVEGAEFPAIAGNVFVELADLPDWIQPAALRELYLLLDQTCLPERRSLVNPLEVTLHSGQRLSCTFGDPKITIADGVAEVVFPVCSRDATLIEPVNPRQNGDPNLALICQTKVALAVARFAIGEGGELTRIGDCELWHRDLIGPARSGLMPADADPDTARIPTLLWSGVMDGKRVYLARALRYVRDEYLGSMEQIERRLFYTREMLDELGHPNLRQGDYPTSFFEDHAYDESGYTSISRNYRPMVDKAQLEELWVIADGVRTIIPVGNQLLLPRIFDDLNWYYFGYGRPRNGYYGPDKNHWLVTEAEMKDIAMAAARGRMHEEAIGYGAVFNTIARITDTDVVVLLHAPEELLDGAAYSFMRVNCVTGEHTILSTVTVGSQDLEIGFYQSLNCYQWEIERDGEVVQEACLMWRSGHTEGWHGDAYVHFSIDGGRSWVGNVLSHHNVPPPESPFFPTWGMAGLGLYVRGPSIKDPSSPLINRPPE